MQVEYSLSDPRWNMPALAYSFEMVAGDTVARFVSVDAISIHDDKNCGELGLAESRGHVTSPDQWLVPQID